MAGGLMHSCTWKESISTQENPYHFTDSGLRNVYLIGVRRVECDCGEKYVEIPAIKQLLSLMARDVVMKREALIGDEIRFLRKQLGQKAADFCPNCLRRNRISSPINASRFITTSLAISESSCFIAGISTYFSPQSHSTRRTPIRYTFRRPESVKW